MTQVKAFSLNFGGPIRDVEKRVEAEANKLLAMHPDIEIQHTAVLPTGSGVSILLVFYTEEKKEKKK